MEPPEPSRKHRPLLSVPDPHSSFRPAVDVYREHRTWFCKFDLAGVAREDIELHARGCRLTVAGVRKDRTLRRGWQAYSMEIAYHRFQRSIDLPCDLESAEIACEFCDGMLLVTIAAQEAE